MDVAAASYFRGHPASRRLFTPVWAVFKSAGPSTMRVTKSQISFSRRRGFAWVWIPGRYLRGRLAPLVLSLRLGRRDRSERWKEVVEVARGNYMHHLEVFAPDQLDEQIAGWVREAWQGAE